MLLKKCMPCLEALVLGEAKATVQVKALQYISPYSRAPQPQALWDRTWQRTALFPTNWPRVDVDQRKQFGRSADE